MKYKVVCREIQTRYSTAVEYIEAENEDLAKEYALDAATDYIKDDLQPETEYDVSEVSEVGPDEWPYDEDEEEQPE